MGILSNIFGKIFHRDSGDAASNAPAPAAPGAQAPAAGQPSGASPAQPTTPISEVDVEKVLNDLAAKNPEKLNWRTSIVDLMKLLGLDSSLNARKELAKELDYTGDTNDSASMNIWLHRQVMTKVAANGGKVPAELRD